MNIKSFWPALERLGVAGAAHDWRMLLGEQWKRAPLRRTPRIAQSVLDPRLPARRLEVADESDETGARFAFFDHDMRLVREGVGREDVAVWEIDWNELGAQLARALRFAACDVRAQNDGVFQVGNVIARDHPTHPVFLFVPCGDFFDAERLLGVAVSLPPCTLLVTRGKWITAEVAAASKAAGIMIDSVAERLEASPDAAGSVVSRSRGSIAHKAAAAILGVRPEWTWSKLRVLVDPVGKIHFRYARESATHTFRSANRKKPPFGLVALGQMAVQGKWTPPPHGSAKHDNAIRAMNRLKNLLRALVPISGEPFETREGDIHPVFQVRLKDRYNE